MKLGQKKQSKAVPKELTKVQKEKRTKTRLIIISAVVSFILLIAIYLIEDAIVNKEITGDVYQAVKSIEANTKITEDNFSDYFRLKSAPVSVIPDSSVTDKEFMIDKYTAYEIEANAFVTEGAFVDKVSTYLKSIEKPVELSVNISTLGDIVSGTLREGDFINIYGLRKQETDSGSVSYFSSSDSLYAVQDRYTFEHIMITKAFNGSGSVIQSNGSESVTMFNITIEEDDAEKFAEMLANCDITVARATYVTDDTYVGYIAPDSQKETSSETNSNMFGGYVEDTSSNVLYANEETTDDTDSEDSDSEDTYEVNADEEADSEGLEEADSEESEEQSEEEQSTAGADTEIQVEGLGPYTVGESQQAQQLYEELYNQITGESTSE